MCGIAGICAPHAAPLHALTEVGAALAHRGPDGEGFAVLSGGDAQVRHGLTLDPLLEGLGSGPQAGLVHRRLSIIDLTDHSAQPMLDAAGKVALAYNGELYNYVELREELRGLGHAFETTGDTEVVLRAYLEWGPACVERFVGMWTFGIIDLHRRALVLSRDRFGIKPLFWTALPGGGVAFASEIKALRRIPGVRSEPDAAVVKRFMLTGVVDDTERTFYAGIEHVRPATNVVLPLDAPVAGRRVERYWEVPAAPSGSLDGMESDAARVRAALRESVRVHLRSDVPVGTCLSGGIDSSGLVGLCDELRRTGQVGEYTHHAFGYVPPGSTEWSEERFMRLAAQRSGAELTVVAPTPEEFDAEVLRIVDQQDEPFGSLSIAAQYFVFGAARRDGMKVMLDGQGADEVFAGYHHFLASIGAGMLRRGEGLRYLHYAARHQRAYGRPPIPWLSLAESTPARHALALARRVRGAAPADRELLAPALRDLDGGGPPVPALDLHGLLVQQTTSVSLPSLLRFEDRNSMAHSLESRVPFLDHRLVELAFSLPPERKLHGMQPKAVLRRALADVLPQEILARRDKIGFRADVSATRRFADRHEAALREVRHDLEGEWLDREAADRLLATGGRDTSTEFALWRLINLKLWLRRAF